MDRIKTTSLFLLGNSVRVRTSMWRSGRGRGSGACRGAGAVTLHVVPRPLLQHLENQAAFNEVLNLSGSCDDPGKRGLHADDDVPHQCLQRILLAVTVAREAFRRGFRGRQRIHLHTPQPPQQQILSYTQH